MSKYLYNDVELPALPEWDKTTYPYAYISDKTNVFGKRSVILWCSTEPLLVYFLTSDKTTMHSDEDGADCINSNLSIDEGTWGEFNESDLTSTSSVSPPIWANTNLYYDDGTLYLPASDPVPVGGEPEQPETVLTNRDLYRKINGQLIKHTLYKKVGGELVKVDEYST